MNNVIVTMKNINKHFPGVKALDDAQFTLRKGEVMALLGENGAGKSTLVKILSGVYTKDSGEMKIFGEEYDSLTTKQAQKLGISIIHQELNMCNHLTVTENIFLAQEPVIGGFILSEKQMHEKAQALLDRLHVDISPDDIIGDLSVSKQQMVEIAKALSQDAKVLIMDEPTSALSSTEIDELFNIIRQLRNEGVAIVYISHRLAELEHIIDRVTILRDGKFIMEDKFYNLEMDEIITHMVGRELTEQFPTIERSVGKEVFRVENLNAGKMVRDVSFTLREGEIVGLAGLMGAGRTEVTRAIFRADPVTSGSMYLDGEEIFVKRPSDAIEQGVVLVPEDRRRDGLCTKLSVRENLALPNLDILSNKLGVVNRAKESQIVDETIEKLSVRLAGPEVLAASLSGGNQQKIVVGKWLIRNSRVVIFDEPTRGIDVAAKVEIYNLMNELKDMGIAVLFVSSEMPEVLGIADRILVMCDGKLTGELDACKTTQEEILKYATMFEQKIPHNA